MPSSPPGPDAFPQFLPEGAVAAVLTPEPIDRLLDYLVPTGGCLEGALVLVPLGPRRVPGVVWGEGQGELPRARLRPIARVLPDPPLTPEFRTFLARAADYTMTPLFAMLRLATRVPGLAEGPSTRKVCRPGAEAPQRLTPQRQRVLDALAAQPGRALSVAELAEEAGVSAGVVRGLLAQGALQEEEAPRDQPFPHLDPDFAPSQRDRRAGNLSFPADALSGSRTRSGADRRDDEYATSFPGRDAPAAAPPGQSPALDSDPPNPPVSGLAHLTSDQARAAAQLMGGIASGRYATTLLQGVTGSGKTEVYLEAVAECLREGRQALVLLPEIALTAEFLRRVEARFGARPAEWHSGLSQAERRRLWHMVGQGGAQLVVGARSALFLPFRDLGLVVVDEEHDGSYKQEEGVLYHARDMAVLRASLADAQVVLASATPSLESWVNAQTGKYHRLLLPGRFGGARLPQMRAIDMRTDDPGPGRWISPSLAGEVTARLAESEQVLLFLNRRGFAPVTLCRVCGQQIGCPHCDARMVEHRFHNRLMCHQCGYTMPIPVACPSCGVEGKLAALGPGVERLAEEVAALWPEARLAVLSSDLFGSARALKEQILKIGAGGADIIIGTQLVAKGHNFPLLTLVGVIDADLGLQGSDLRAAEHSFQLMRQVSGRAGRAGKPGLALLQTWQPEHTLIRAILAGDEEGFWRAEAAERRAAGMPPFGRLAALILSGPEPAPLFELGQKLARSDGLLRAIGAEVWGPAAAPIARIRDRYRVRLLVKAPRGVPLQAALARWTAPLRPRNPLRLVIDIDPQSFL